MFKEEIKKWIKIVRSLNGVVVFSTQSLSDVINSSISDVILENCPTKILLANIEAKNDISSVMYKKLGLSDGHIDIISSMTPKKDYFYMSPEGKRIMNLELDPYTLRFFNADMKNVEKARKITGDFYEQWKTIDLSSE
jgi:type IV secretion system protein VirB4